MPIKHAKQLQNPDSGSADKVYGVDWNADHVTDVTTGYILFAYNNTVTGDSNLYWDITNKRLGIGTTSPSEKIHVIGNIKSYSLLPNSDNTYDLGSSSLRWRNIYLSKDIILANKGVNVTVSAGATNLAVTLPVSEPDTNYGVIVTPQWNTTIWITNKTTTGFTINFGTAPSTNSALDWMVYR